MTAGDAAPSTDHSSASDDAEPSAQDDPESSSREAAGATVGAGGRREVEVPDSLYKIVTVFSTLLAVLFVVVGLSVLSSATVVLSNPPGSLVVQLLSVLVPMGLLVEFSGVIALVVALMGVALVAGGAAIYVFGSRFRAPGMGKPKDEADEGSGDG